MLNRTPARGQETMLLLLLETQGQGRRGWGAVGWVGGGGPGCGSWSAGSLAYLRWGLRSSSPRPQHRRQPASLCSGIHSGKSGKWESDLGPVACLSPPHTLPLELPPYLVDTSKEGEELAEKGGTHAGDMHKRALGSGASAEWGRSLP